MSRKSFSAQRGFAAKYLSITSTSHGAHVRARYFFRLTGVKSGPSILFPEPDTATAVIGQTISHYRRVCQKTKTYPQSSTRMQGDSGPRGTCRQLFVHNAYLTSAHVIAGQSARRYGPAETNQSIIMKCVQAGRLDCQSNEGLCLLSGGHADQLCRRINEMLARRVLQTNEASKITPPSLASHLLRRHSSSLSLVEYVLLASADWSGK